MKKLNRFPNNFQHGKGRANKFFGQSCLLLRQRQASHYQSNNLLAIWRGIQSAIFALFAPPQETEEEISLNKLAQDINQENIERVKVRGDELTVFYKDETQARSKKEAETALTQSLINFGVRYTYIEVLDDVQKIVMN